jgi:hypothetical protein
MIGVVLLAQTVAQRCLGEMPSCIGKYKEVAPSTAELKQILKQHDAWMNSVLYPDDRRRANLCGAILMQAHLAGANLFYANLAEANLIDANLSHANLADANLADANLAEANLSHANLGAANLSGAKLWGANLAAADLFYANLSAAELGGANLAGAYLDFDPETLPKVVPGISNARNIELVKFHEQAAGLVKLRKQLKDYGLRSQESQLT